MKASDMNKTTSFGKNILLSIGTILVVFIFIEIFGRSFYFHTHASQSLGILYVRDMLTDYVRASKQKNFLNPNPEVHELEGVPLNKRAWEASFEERGLIPPFGEPREGYWGARIHPKKEEKFLRYVERPLNISGLVYVDDDGFQHVRIANHQPDYSILILGGSVAYGAYASKYEHTYFANLVHMLAEEQIYVEISVLAAGAWVSTDELMAFVIKGLDRHPDVTIFFNGLNDLTNIDTNYQQHADEYLRNMTKAKSIALANSSVVIYALQPFLPGKETHTPLEKRIMELSPGAYEVAPFYADIRKGLQQLHDGNNAFFIDCSKVFDHEPYTTFADLWHFSDPGHVMLAEILSEEIMRIISHAL